MTLFVASLFLPQTLGFVQPEDADVHKQVAPVSSNIPNLLNSFASRMNSNAPTRQDTPIISPDVPSTPPRSLMMSPAGGTDTAQASQDETISLLSARLNKVKFDPNAAKSKRTLTIPQSRASSPPEAALVTPRPANMRTISMTRPAEYVPGEDKRRDSMPKRKGQHSANPAYSTARYQTFDQDKGNGGLRNALCAAYQSGRIDKPVWVGLLGIPTDEIPETTMIRITQDFETQKNINSLIVNVSDDTARLGYDHYCILQPLRNSKRMLWPIFHYQIPDSPKTRIYEEQSYKYYEQLNQAFANRISDQYKRGDTIWINDYHLLLAPKMIRERHPHAMIGLFLHIAFPSSEVFRCLEKRKQLLYGMLASNVIGFQTLDHCHHFKQTCSRLLYVETTDCGIQLEHSFVRILALPIGIDPKQLSHDIESLGVKDMAKTISSRFRGPNMKIIVGRDKLDHVKGVLHKLRAFGEFLRLNPNQQGRVILMQFGTPAKKDPILAAEIRDLVTKINSKYSIIALDYQPILLKPDVSYQEYLALITMADVFIVSSVREGMNLTCHEYIYCQQECKNPLILSEFVGSAQLFEKDALMVNPFDYKQTAEAIRLALLMSEDEKARRWHALNKIVHKEDGGRWAETFINQIPREYIDQMKKRSVDLPPLNPDSFRRQYDTATKRLFFIDYEGTLVRWETNTSVIAGTGKIVELLNMLASDDRNTVYITSERTPSELERSFRRCGAVGLVAENGGYVRWPEDGTWVNLTDPSVLRWKESVREIVQYYKERTPGTFIEEQNNRIVFHYGSAENMESAQRQVSEMHNHIMDSAAGQDVHALPLKNALVVEPSSITKATAADHILKHMDDAKDIDFIVTFGNDRSDEELFAWTNNCASRVSKPRNVTTLTANVGVRNTEARMYLNSTFRVHTALEAWMKQS